MNNKHDIKFYEVTFILEQRGDYIDWIENNLLEGLREGEAILDLSIAEIPSQVLTEH